MYKMVFKSSMHLNNKYSFIEKFARDEIKLNQWEINLYCKYLNERPYHELPVLCNPLLLITVTCVE